MSPTQRVFVLCHCLHLHESRPYSVIMDDIVFKTPFYGVTALPRPRATIHDLPNEILAEIFILNLLHYREGYGFFHPPNYPSALLTSVCTHWTLVALKTPPLWDTLKVNTGFVWKPSPSQVARFFARSRNRNLVLHYTKQAFDHMNVDPRIPWSRITELKLTVNDEFPLEPFRKLLMYTPNLVWFEAKRMTGDLDMPAFPTTTLPHLQHLILRFISREPMEIDEDTRYNEVMEYGQLRWARSSPFFLSLVLPKLVYLNIDCEGFSPDPDLMQVLTDLQLRSGFTLETLRLIGIDLDFNTLFKFFAHVPELRCLSLDSGYPETQDYHQVLRRLQLRKDREDNLLPRLQNIFIRDTDAWPDHGLLDDIALSTLESRWWPGDLCPYKQENLGMLKKAVIIWYQGMDREAPITHPEARLRAQSLRNKMVLSYPTLGFPGEDVTEY